jgi:hypothetical protein
MSSVRCNITRKCPMLFLAVQYVPIVGLESSSDAVVVAGMEFPPSHVLI